MTVREAILKALESYKIGDVFSLLSLTEKVEFYRGKWVTDGTVSRYLRWFNEGVFDRYGIIFRWKVIKPGVYRIIRKEKLEKNQEGTSQNFPSYSSQYQFKPVKRNGEFYLF